MINRFEVKDFNPSEVDKLITVFKNSVDKVARNYYSEAQCRAWAPDDIDPKAWVERLSEQKTIVVYSDSKPAGFLAIDDSGYLDMIFVDSTYIRCGVASLLMTEAIKYSQERSVDKITSDVSKAARQFFEHHGFHVLTEQSVAVRGQQLTNYKMEKKL